MLSNNENYYKKKYFKYKQKYHNLQDGGMFGFSWSSKPKEP